MTSVHAVLRNWDILQVIINFVEDDFNWRSRLVTVALVCRGLSDLALNVLWRDIDLKDVNSLFPMDIIRVGYRGKKSLTRMPATPQEWERFDVYASRIRELSASPSSNDLFLRGFQTRYPTLHHPFPNLTWLEWSSTSSSIRDAMTLLCPTITEVKLSIYIDRLREDEDADEHDDAVADIVRGLGETCPRLKTFEYTQSSTAERRSKAIEASLIYLIHQCHRLEDVHLPVSRDILRSLASLPHLWILQLDHVEWEDRAQLTLPIQADEWIEEANRFPVLDDLIIQGSHTVSSLTKCFQESGCFPKKRFIMREMSEYTEWSTPAIAEFFRGISRPDRREELLVFSIDRESDEDLLEVDPWQPLQCLSSIPNLQTLTLNGFLLDIKDADLEEIAQIWPELQSLRLDVPDIDDYESRISFQGLAHLSTLKNLRNVSLMLAPDSTISESMLAPSTPSNSLKYLKVHGKFPPVPPYPAAIFLILHFPRLERLTTSLEFDERAEQRMEVIQGLLKSARLMAKNLRSEWGESGTHV